MKLIFILLTLVLLLPACAKKPMYPDAPLTGETIVVDTRTLKDKSPVFYSFHYNNKKIDFFIVKINGEVQSYFDACARCYTDKLGYRTDGESVICKKCGVRYSIEGLKAGIGSCYPIVLKGKIDGDKYIIDKKAVIEGNIYF